MNKLNRIIIPKIEFRDATVREAVDFLKIKSRDLDVQEPDPTRRGINIVLQLESPPAELPAPAAGRGGGRRRPRRGRRAGHPGPGGDPGQSPAPPRRRRAPAAAAALPVVEPRRSADHALADAISLSTKRSSTFATSRT